MQSVAHSFGQSYAAVPRVVADARARLADFASAAGADRTQVEAITLATSEALTNAVLHAYGDRPGKVHVTAAVVAEEVWVLIADDGCGLAARSDRPGLGLGLGLIAQMSDQLAIVPRSGGGTEVRMRFNLGSAVAGGVGAADGRRRRARSPAARDRESSRNSAGRRAPARH